MPLKEDQFSDEDSDGEKPPNVDYQDYKEFLAVLEKDDNKVKEVRDKAIYSKRDDIIDVINQNLL